MTPAEVQTLLDSCKQVSARDAAIRAGVSITERGNKGWARCVFHSDDKPSLAFYEDGRYYCFGCHASGDALMFYQRMYSLGAVGAAQRLLSDFGLSAPTESATKEIAPRITGKALQDRCERVRERRIDELLALKRKALSQIADIEKRPHLSEDDRAKVMRMQAHAATADHHIAMLELYDPQALVEWVAAGAQIDGI